MADTKSKKSAAKETTPRVKTLNQYEAMFLFGPTAANDLDGAIKTVRGIVERFGGEIMVIKKWDERRLAYEIEGQKRGTYIICFFKAPGSAVTGIERDVNLSEEILRVMVLKAEHLSIAEMNAVEPQPIQVREERSFDRPWERDDRGGRDDRGPRDGPRDDRGPRTDRYERPADRPAADRPPLDKPRANHDEPLADKPEDKD